MYTEHVCANLGGREDDAEAHLVLAEEEDLFRLGGGACGILVMSVTHGVVQNCFSLYIKPVTEALGFTRQGFSVCQMLTNVIYMGIACFPARS